MIDKDKIADAAWANDALADEGHDLPTILRTLGIDNSDAIYVAEQRALRMVLAQRGDATIMQMKRDAYERHVRTIKLSPTERMTQVMMMAVWLDAFCAGVRAAKDASLIKNDHYTVIAAYRNPPSIFCTIGPAESIQDAIDNAWGECVEGNGWSDADRDVEWADVMVVKGDVEVVG